MRQLLHVIVAVPGVQGAWVGWPHVLWPKPLALQVSQHDLRDVAGRAVLDPVVLAHAVQDGNHLSGLDLLVALLLQHSLHPVTRKHFPICHHKTKELPSGQTWPNLSLVMVLADVVIVLLFCLFTCFGSWKSLVSEKTVILLTSSPFSPASVMLPFFARNTVRYRDAHKLCRKMERTTSLSHVDGHNWLQFQLSYTCLQKYLNTYQTDENIEMLCILGSIFKFFWSLEANTSLQTSPTQGHLRTKSMSPWRHPTGTYCANVRLYGKRWRNILIITTLKFILTTVSCYMNLGMNMYLRAWYHWKLKSYFIGHFQGCQKALKSW